MAGIVMSKAANFFSSGSEGNTASTTIKGSTSSGGVSSLIDHASK